jgi:hypothetical protein
VAIVAKDPSEVISLKLFKGAGELTDPLPQSLEWDWRRLQMSLTGPSIGIDQWRRELRRAEG